MIAAFIDNPLRWICSATILMGLMLFGLQFLRDTILDMRRLVCGVVLFRIGDLKPSTTPRRIQVVLLSLILVPPLALLLVLQVPRLCDVNLLSLAIPLSIPLAVALVVKSTSPEVSFARAFGASVWVLLQGALGMLFVWAVVSAVHSGV